MKKVVAGIEVIALIILILSVRKIIIKRIDIRVKKKLKIITEDLINSHTIAYNQYLRIVKKEPEAKILLRGDMEMYMEKIERAIGLIDGSEMENKEEVKFRLIRIMKNYERILENKKPIYIR